MRKRRPGWSRICEEMCLAGAGGVGLGGYMKPSKRWLGAWVAGLMVVAGISSVSAELPTMQEKEWLGNFVGFANKKYQFGLTAQGKAAIRLTGKDDGMTSRKLAIPVDFMVEEISPDGKVTVKSVQPESLESAQPATNKPQDVTIKGKVTGGATFEMYIDEDRGVMAFGGRLLDPGTLKNPLRFSIRVRIPDVYADSNKGVDKKEQKAFEEKAKSDRVQLSWTDGKRVKQDADKVVDANSKELNGPGIAAAQITLSPYLGKKLEFVSSANSSMNLGGEKAAPLHGGFSLVWIADQAKDPDGKARLTFEVK